MPIYEYECESCGLRFEQMQSVQDNPVHQCPECTGRVHKVFFPAGIIFRGSGWYVTDSRKTNSSTVPSESKPSASESKADTASTKTETKTAAQSETK